MSDSVNKRISLIEEGLPKSAPWISDHYPQGSVVRPADSTTSILMLHGNTRTPCLSKENADFIATSPTDIRWLIATLRKSRAQFEVSRRLNCPWCGGKVYTDMSCGRDASPVGFDCDSCPARWDLAGDVVNDGTLRVVPGGDIA